MSIVYKDAKNKQNKMEDLAGKLGFVRTFLHFFLFLIFSSSVSLVYVSGVLVVTLCRLKKVYKGGQFVNRPLTNITLTRIVIQTDADKSRGYVTCVMKDTHWPTPPNRSFSTGVLNLESCSTKEQALNTWREVHQRRTSRKRS